MKQPLQRIALTPGEPAGIGPDLCIQCAQQAHPVELVAIADPQLLESRARLLGLPLQLSPVDLAAPPQPQCPGTLKIQPHTMARPALPGRLDSANVDYVLTTLRTAAAACQRGDYAALVTGPVNKEVINRAGHPFTGHTEFLAQLTGTSQVVMMLATPGLRVALVTTHLPLREIFSTITPAWLEQTLRITWQGLHQLFCLPDPRLLVCGLNPHAGEGGHMGREEIDIIEPVLERLRQEGMKLYGPLPADTIFIDKYLQVTDAVVAMYHDQGLPVLKHMGFGKAINITLGLPFIRTSVDHGTALDLAGSGRADTGSLEAALQTAVAMSARPRQAA